ncbi:MAG: hypothetical protein ACE5HE_10305 [Phycisphaerae bacterium]
MVKYPDEQTTGRPAFGDDLTGWQMWLAITLLHGLDAHACAS